MESSFLPGFYIKNDDADLGKQPFFRAKLGLGYRFSKSFSASISYDHRSNGRINGVNPGMETLQANIGFYYWVKKWEIFNFQADHKFFQN